LFVFTIAFAKAIDLTKKPEPMPATEFKFPDYKTVTLKNGVLTGLDMTGGTVAVVNLPTISLNLGNGKSHASFVINLEIGTDEEESSVAPPYRHRGARIRSTGQRLSWASANRIDAVCGGESPRRYCGSAERIQAQTRGG